MHLCDRILAVDDNRDNLNILEELLANDYTVLGVASGEEALRMAPRFRPDLILLDVMMPGLDGIETCRRMQALPELKGSRIVMLSAKNKLNDRLAAYDVGAVDYIAKPFDHYEVASKVRAWMRVVHKEQVDEIWRAADKAQAAVGAAMLNLASFRDTETGDHLFRVRWYGQTLVEKLAVSGAYRAQIDDEFRTCFYRASPLHDIGKIAIDDTILRKPGPLTEDEFEIMKTHTTVGSEILRSAYRQMPQAKYLGMAAEIARHHHERFDGSGYPDQLSGTAIPLAARILCVVDYFDAMTSERAYHKSVSVSEAGKELQAGSGTQFDPVIVDAFHLWLDDFRQAHTRFSRHCAMYDGALTPLQADPGASTSPIWHVDRVSEHTSEMQHESMLMLK